MPTAVEHPWMYTNIVDKGMMGRAAVRVLEGTDIKLGAASLAVLSNGLQQHLKNVLEAALRVSRSRQSRTAVNTYEGELAHAE